MLCTSKTFRVTVVTRKILRFYRHVATAQRNRSQPSGQKPRWKIATLQLSYTAAISSTGQNNEATGSVGEAPCASALARASAVRTTSANTSTALRGLLTSTSADSLLFHGKANTVVLDALLCRAMTIKYSDNASKASNSDARRQELLRFDSNSIPASRMNSHPPVYTQGWAKRSFCVKSRHVHVTTSPYSGLRSRKFRHAKFIQPITPVLITPVTVIRGLITITVLGYNLLG